MMQVMERFRLPQIIKQYVYLKQALETEPDDDQLRFDLAKVCLSAGLYRTALKLCADLRVYGPDIEEIDVSARSTLSHAPGRSCVIAVDKTGDLVVANYTANRLAKVTPEGEQVWVYEKEGFEDDALYHPSKLTVDGEGTIFTASSSLSRIQVFNSSGGFERVFPVPKKFGESIRIESIACDASGNIWIVDSDGRKLRLLSPYGDELASFINEA